MRVLVTTCAAVLAVATAGAGTAQAAPGTAEAPEHLTVNDLTQPLNMAGPPRFGWLPRDRAGDEIQTAYRIVVRDARTGARTDVPTCARTPSVPTGDADGGSGSRSVPRRGRGAAGPGGHGPDQLAARGRQPRRRASSAWAASRVSGMSSGCHSTPNSFRSGEPDRSPRERSRSSG